MPGLTPSVRRNLASLMQQEQLVIQSTCRVCSARVDVEFTEWDVPDPLSGKWTCPRCRRVNTLPALGRVIGVRRQVVKH
jgi:hypothetical protein